jgi:UDP-N-acetylmuramoylalanine--D-glutamate ligase
VITPIFSDHQNWYHAMAPYVADKKVIYENMTPADCLVCNAGEPWAREFQSETRARFVKVDENSFPRDLRLLVPGAHNRLNALTAIIACEEFGVSRERCTAAVATWPGLPHRLEYFHSRKLQNGSVVRFYNDTTATVPEATVAAMSAFAEEGAPLHLIAGGTDKGADFTGLADALAATPPKSLHLLAGTATDKLLPLLQARDVSYFGSYDGLDPLLAHLSGILETNGEAGVAVFSPGATSFGMFKNEFDRGDTFKALVGYN